MEGEEVRSGGGGVEREGNGWKEAGKEGWREGWREGGREGGREEDLSTGIKVVLGRDKLASLRPLLRHTHATNTRPAPTPDTRPPKKPK